MNKNLALAGIALLLVVSVLAVRSHIFFPARESPSEDQKVQVEKNSAVSPNSSDGDVGIIASSTTGFNSYTSNKYHFSFNFPADWRLGDNNIGWGTLQIENYDSSLYGGEGWPPGINKIEAVILTDPGTYFAIPNDKGTQVTIAGQNALRNFDAGDGILSYVIPLPKVSGKYLGISMYGDPANYSVLDDLLKTLKLDN